MFTKSSSYYDLIYHFKDYKKESQKIARIIRRMNPRARTVLDAACGTGAHDRYLKKYFRVDGIDLNRAFLKAAKKKNKAGIYRHADMQSFRLRKRYDAVVCLFSSIGYLPSLAALKKTLSCFHTHLDPGGIAIIEPWITPGEWKPGSVHLHTYNGENLKISRVALTRRKGRKAVITFYYLAAQADGNCRYFTERHITTLFSVSEILRVIRKSGFRVTYHQGGLIGRGLYIALKK